MTSDAGTSPPATGDKVATFVQRAVRLLVRLLFAALLGIGLGIAAYVGAPALYRHYIEPVQVNSQRLTDLEQAFRQSQEADRQERTALHERLTELESDLATQAEALAGLQAQVERQGDDLNALAGVPDRLAALEGDLEQTLADIASLEGSLATADGPTQRLARQLQLIRAMELLTRARLWLTQSNLGLAASDIESARQVLLEAAEAAPEEEALPIHAIIDRLDTALTDLQTSPIVAADDLEIAWRLLFSATAP